MLLGEVRNAKIRLPKILFMIFYLLLVFLAMTKRQGGHPDRS